MDFRLGAEPDHVFIAWHIRRETRPDNTYEMMMGEKSRDIKFASLLAEGDDYEQVSSQWLNPWHT